MTGELNIKPIKFKHSLLFFGLPCAVIYPGIYHFVPLLDSRGVPLIVSWNIFMMGVIALLLPASIMAYKLEGNEMTWDTFKERFRLNPITGKAWLWILGTFIVVQTAEVLITVSGVSLASVRFLAPPEIIPSFMDPNIELTIPVTEFFNVPVKGNWWLIFFWLGWLFFNMFGEEFLWRGYLLPRHELTYGKWAWLIHGLLWAFVFHAFMKWQYIGLLPSNLLIPFLAQKLKNTWASMLVHLAGNAMVFVLIVPGIIGS